MRYFIKDQQLPLSDFYKILNLVRKHKGDVNAVLGEYFE
jgi:hypothetical protein